MDRLTLRVFNVGNGDCLLLETENQELCAIDFCRLDSTPEHPLHPGNQCGGSHVIFACLTHPHHDHMTKIEKMGKLLKFVVENGGEFWHTVADMAEVLQLYEKAAFTSHNRNLVDELKRLAYIATIVAEEFPRERIRFVCSDTEIASRLCSTPGLDIKVLGPSRVDAVKYVHMLCRVNKGELQTVDDRVINRISAMLRIRHGENTIVLGGDAPATNWKKIIGRSGGESIQPMRVQAVKASHHGSNDSFYPELWDDLFGASAGIVLVSANGVTRPTKTFLESFQLRKHRGISDEVHCTGLIDPQRRPEFLPLLFQPLLDKVSQPVKCTGAVPWGPITVAIPYEGPIEVSQPYSAPV